MATVSGVSTRPRQVRAIELLWDTVPARDEFPFVLPAIRALRTLEFDTPVTFLTGDNGSGKSTLIEAIAMSLGFNAEGGTRNFDFAHRPSESRLYEHLGVSRNIGAGRGGFFLRAESFFNLATAVDELGMRAAYGGRSLHEQSHGESFLALVNHRFEPDGIYVLDEPEAALSVRGQLALLRGMHDLVATGAQFVVATHSPILLAFPDAAIHQLSSDGMTRVEYADAECVQLTKSFLDGPERFLRHLFSDDD
jgi:predicted ATPase